MTTQAVLTLLKLDQDVLRVAVDSLSPRGCEFLCNDEQLALFRQDDANTGKYESFTIKLSIYPHSGPRPQFVTAEGQITSVRRCTQDSFRVIIQFQGMQQDGYRLIAEHLSPLDEDLSGISLNQSA